MTDSPGEHHSPAPDPTASSPNGGSPWAAPTLPTSSSNPTRNPATWPSTAPQPPSGRRRRVRADGRASRVRRGALITVGVLAVASLPFIAIAMVGSNVSAHSFDGDLVLYSDGKEPAPPVAEQAALIAPIPAAPPFVRPAGRYEFIWTNPDQSPVRWDPCEPIRFVLNDDLAPAGGAQMLTEAIEQVQDASGLDFELVGTTAERPSATRDPTVGQGADERWAPVLIAWSEPSSDPGLAGRVLGYADPVGATYGVSGIRRLVTGTVSLDVDDLDGVREDYGRSAARSVIVHELAHLIGLDHVADPDSLMNSSTDFTVTAPDADDRIGLLVAGGGQCFP